MSSTLKASKSPGSGRSSVAPRKLNDSEYCSLLDSMARNYNSQMTTHVGYLLTSVFGPLTFVSLAGGWLGDVLLWLSCMFSHCSCGHPLPLWIGPLLFLCLASFYVLCPVRKPRRNPYVPPVWSPLYLFARMYYYIELSQVVWDHMGINAASKRRFDQLKKRAFEVRDLRKLYPPAGFSGIPKEEEHIWWSMGIQKAIVTCFEARLYLTLRKTRTNRKLKVEEKERWASVFFFKPFLDANLELDGFGKSWAIRHLLLFAHGKTLRTYAGKDDYDGAVYDMFKPFLRLC